MMTTLTSNLAAPLDNTAPATEAAPAPVPRRHNRLQSNLYKLIHLTLFAPLFMPFAWKWVALAVASYYVRMFGITAGYHRYFSHRSYKLGRVPQFLLAFLAQASAQKGALWWAANHRHHHRYSDEVEDIHSPKQRGFFWAHTGWLFAPEFDETRYELIPDFARYPELVWLNKHHHVPTVVYALTLFALFGLPGLIWGFFVSTVVLWHGTFTINSLAHMWGSRRYATADTSRNNLFLTLITLGEGWHNNHHCYMNCARQGFFWWEVDPTYYLLKAGSWVGLVGGLRNPPLKLLEAKRL